MMFMASEETFGSQRSLRRVPPSEKLHPLPKYTRNQDINTQRGNAARLPEPTPALYHNFINCSWSLWYSERCTNCEESKHTSWAKCATENTFILNIHIETYCRKAPLLSDWNLFLFKSFIILIKDHIHFKQNQNNWSLLNLEMDVFSEHCA